MSALNFTMADLYPGMAGYYTTRTTTVPEAEDQNALVDDEEASRENSVHTSPAAHRNMFMSIAVVVAIMMLYSFFS
jgi:capsular polysaccharide biosynthesis protein